VKAIGEGTLELPDGRIVPAATVVLATGLSPHPLLATLDLPKDRKGRISVDATMRATARPEVWALGDCASIPGPDGKPYPPLAQHALRQAKVLARNIVAGLAGRKPAPFVYRSLGMLASLGHYSGVGRVLFINLRGFPAWWVWRTYYLLQMPRLERKIRILMDWTVALLFRYDVVELDLFGEEHPLRSPRGTAPGSGSRVARAPPPGPAR
jgi:NADH dehydrogenase